GQKPMQPSDFEYESLEISDRREHRLSRIDEKTFHDRFPAWRGSGYRDGVLEREAGYVESGLVVTTLVKHAKQLGVEMREGVRFAQLDEDVEKIRGIVLTDNARIPADAVVMAT